MRTVKELVAEWFVSATNSADYIPSVPKKYRQEVESRKANPFIYSNKGLTLRYTFKKTLMTSDIHKADVLTASSSIQKIYRKAMHVWQEATNGTIQFKEVNPEEGPAVLLGVCGSETEGDRFGVAGVFVAAYSARDGKQIRFGFPSFICLMEQNSVQMRLIDEGNNRILRGITLFNKDTWVHIAAHELEHILLPFVPHLPLRYRHFSPSCILRI